jgi:hypothetical protein
MLRRSVVLGLALAAAMIVGGATTTAQSVASPTPSSSPAPSALPTCLGESVYQGPDGQYLRPTTFDNSRNVNCMLTVGSRSKAVRTLQRALIVCYGQPLAFDGIYGLQTRAAVQQVQLFHGISPADGVFGPQTNLAMRWPYGNAHCFVP